jgi:hypothetical protein
MTATSGQKTDDTNLATGDSGEWDKAWLDTLGTLPEVLEKAG